MTEREQLIQLNEGLKRVEISINKLNSAVLGDEFNENGILPRLKNVEKKQKRIDNFFYVILGAVTLGAYPIAKPFINQWFKT
jgi:hypothetical protein